MKVKVVSVEELVKALEGDAGDTLEAALGSLLGSNQRVCDDLLDNHQKRLAKNVPAVLEEYLSAMLTNPCDHAAHRTVPTHDADYIAIFNFLRGLVTVDSRVNTEMHATSYSVGRAIEGNRPPVTELHTETLYIISATALAVATELLAEHYGNLSMLRFHKLFEETLRAELSSKVERLLTVKAPAEKAPSHAHCH